MDTQKYNLKLERASAVLLSASNNLGIPMGDLVVRTDLNLEGLTGGFEVQDYDGDLSAYTLGREFNCGENRVIQTFLSFVGNNYYFVQGRWSSYGDSVLEYSEVGLLIRKIERYLQVFPLREPFVSVVTPKAAEDIVRYLKRY